MKLKFSIPHHADVLRHAMHGLHGGYFSMVFIEGHGFYAILAGVLAILTVANYFLHFD